MFNTSRVSYKQAITSMLNTDRDGLYVHPLAHLPSMPSNNRTTNGCELVSC